MPPQVYRKRYYPVEPKRTRIDTVLDLFTFGWLILLIIVAIFHFS